MSGESSPVSATDSSVVTVLGPLPVPGVNHFDHEDSVAASLSPAYVLRQTDGDDTKYAIILGEGLGRRALMDLLYALAPYKAHGPDRFSRVLDNWGLHDRAMTSSTSENLLRQHADSLKSSWHVFTEHRSVFMDIFKDVPESTRVLPVISWEKDRNGKRMWRLDALDESLASAIKSRVPALRDRGDGLRVDALVGLVAVPYFQPSLYRNWRAWQPLVRNGKSNYVGPASVPVVALQHRRAILNSRVILAAEELDFEARRRSA